MPRRLPPMSDFPRETPCPQCVHESIGKTGAPCQRPSLHQAVGRFWDKLLQPDTDIICSPRRGLVPLGDYSPPPVPTEDGPSPVDLADPETTPARTNILPPLPPHIEMAVMRKLYMSGMTISPRSRQIQPLPDLGEGNPFDMDNDDDDDSLDVEEITKVRYDPSLLDENLVHDLNLDDLLRPETPLPTRAKLNPISTPRQMRHPSNDIFPHKARAIGRMSRLEEDEEYNSSC